VIPLDAHAALSADREGAELPAEALAAAVAANPEDRTTTPRVNLTPGPSDL
jgi:hypothetical protein